MSPEHGRVLIYVWAIEQDELSKRIIPQEEFTDNRVGRDVIVPWVLSDALNTTNSSEDGKGQVYNRYYHMFARGELRGLVIEAATGLGLVMGVATGQPPSTQGVEIVQDSWERSNYYVELRCWRVA